MIILLELLGVLLIAGGVFILSVPFGLIFVGLSVLTFTFAFERSKKAAKN
jgi:hypothetical protein